MITQVREELESGKYKYLQEPEVHQSVNPTVAEFVFKAHAALSKFRSEWMASHEGDTFALGLELDMAAVLTDGMVMGFMGLSEVVPDGYDYFPARSERIEE